MSKWNFAKFIFIGLLLPTLCYAQVSSPGEQASPFQPGKWRRSVDLIESKLATTDWTTEKIDNTLAVLTDLQKNARECIRYTQSELDRINIALTQTATNGANATQQTATASLSSNEIELNDLRAECRLFMMHSQDVINEVDKLDERLIETEVFTKGASLLQTFHQLPTISTLLGQVDTNVLRQQLGFPYFTFSGLVFLAVLLLLGCALYRYCAARSAAFLARLDNKSPLYALSVTFSRYSYALVATLVVSVYCMAYGWLQDFPFFSRAFTYIFVYLLLFALVEAVFCPPRGAKALVVLPWPIPHELKNRIFCLLSLTLVYYLCNALILGQNFPVEVYVIGRALYLCLLSLSVISIAWLAMQFPRVRELNRYIRGILNGLITALLLVVLLSECFGFHYLSIFLIKNIVLTFILTCIACILQILVVEQIHALKSNVAFRHFFGVHYHRSIPELTLLQVVLLILIWGAYAGSLLHVWILSEVYYAQLKQALLEGFTVFNLYLVPSRVIFAALLFVFLILVNRLIQVSISRRSPYYVEEGAQVATATIAGYVGFLVFLIFSLVIAGINFTGLAIIAGALSVGIGFGLQNIANNFISGLILLLDNPIRPGDRIQVGDIEGVVKRIRLRATHIYTSRHADVFVPNSELISKSVTNFVFHDTTWGVVCPVTVEYGCDLAHVTRLLLAVASKHPDVIQDEKKKPTVLVKKLADSGVLIELWCLISDVSKKSQIESDLNAGVYEAFKEHHINIPYPQQDLHIKDWPEKPEPESELE